MQVNKINSQSFQGFNVLKAGNVFFDRLNKPERYIKYNQLYMCQQNNPFDIVIEAGKKKNLLATIEDKDGTVLYGTSERKYRGLFNLSPIKFLENLCVQADRINAARDNAKIK